LDARTGADKAASRSRDPAFDICDFLVSFSHP
jgi:hypothetical protein